MAVSGPGALPIAGAGAGEVRQGLFLLMELCWLAAALLMLDAALAAPNAGAIAIAVVLYPAGYALGRLVLGRGRRLWVPLALAAVAFVPALAGLAAAVMPEIYEARVWIEPALLDLPAVPEIQRLLAMAVGGGLCWLRGWMLAERRVDLDGFAVGFQLGFVVFLVLLWLGASVPIRHEPALALAVAFVLLGLIGLWHARATAPGPTEEEPARARSPGLAALGLLAVLALGLGLWLAVDRGLIEALLVPVYWLAHQLVRLLAYLASLLPQADGTLEMPAAPERAPGPSAPREPPWRVSEVVRRLGEIMFFTAVIALLAALLFTNLRDLLRWLRQRGRSTPDVAYGRSRSGLRETLRELWAGLVVAVREAFARLGRRLRVLAVRDRSDGPARMLYRRLQRRLARRGWPRAAHESPEEYRRRLLAIWPDDGRDLAALTAAFVAERYGGQPADPGLARITWRRLRRTIRRVQYRDERSYEADQR